MHEPGTLYQGQRQEASVYPTGSDLIPSLALDLQLLHRVVILVCA